MLEHLDAIVGAFRSDDTTFNLYLLEKKIFTENMTPTHSKGASAGRVWIVRKTVFIEKGISMGDVILRESTR
jgi:hypothetical protein